MKKLLLIFAAAMMLTACSSVESKLNDAKKAIEDGKYEKAEKILKEIKVEDLNAEQKKQYLEVQVEALSGKAGEWMDAAGAAAEKVMNNASEAASKWMDEASSAVDNFMEDYE